MKVLICGSRDFSDEQPIKDVIKSLPTGTIIIEGGAKGADSLARQIAETHGLKVEEYKAEWKLYGLSAGPIRNKKMLEEGKPDIVYAFYTDKNKSKGTKNMVKLAIQKGVKVVEYDQTLCKA